MPPPPPPPQWKILTFSTKSKKVQSTDTAIAHHQRMHAPLLLHTYAHLRMQRNIIHGSDAVESAQREIALWFPEGVTSGPVMGKEWIYEN